MLAGLTIVNVVLIDRLRVDFAAGLSALTGETGAGKSILLDALGLALGSRAESHLVRAGSSRASVAAEFLIADDHPARAVLAAADLYCEPAEPIVARRTLNADGRSRASINDQPVSVGLLRRLGRSLAEIHGQFDTQGLRDSGKHLALLDVFMGRPDLTAATRAAWRDWRRLEGERKALAEQVARARREEDFLRHALAELTDLAPEPEEEEALDTLRNRLRHRDALHETLRAALDDLDGEGGARSRLGRALGRLERRQMPDGNQAALSALARADAEVEEAAAQLAAEMRELEEITADLDDVESRLFALRAAARKFGTEVAALPAYRDRLAADLAAMDDTSAALDRLAAQVDNARADFKAAGERLAAARRQAAGEMQTAIMAELPPLKLDKARFEIRLETLPESKWDAGGQDSALFTVATNPGAAAGPLDKIASGGELARLMLAVKVVLAERESVSTMIFDEVDDGVGGAVADAVGDRLERLGRRHQVLVVTHSPQVAAKAHDQWQVVKFDQGATSMTDVVRLTDAARREEIARMLSGAKVTEQARAAAESLLTAAPAARGSG